MFACLHAAFLKSLEGWFATECTIFMLNDTSETYLLDTLHFRGNCRLERVGFALVRISQKLAFEWFYLHFVAGWLSKISRISRISTIGILYMTFVVCNVVLAENVVCVCLCACVVYCVCVCMHVVSIRLVCVYAYMCLHSYIYVYVCMYIYVYKHIYIYI